MAVEMSGEVVEMVAKVLSIFGCDVLVLFRAKVRVSSWEVVIHNYFFNRK